MPSGNLESKKNLSTNYGNKNGLKMLYLFNVSCLRIAHGPFPVIFAITFTNLPAIWKENVVNKLHSTKLKILSNLVQQQKTVTFVSARKIFCNIVTKFCNNFQSRINTIAFDLRENTWKFSICIRWAGAIDFWYKLSPVNIYSS